ncbi:hypothetical protein QJS10_CPA06g00163 [Acorus calamus]|uniref:Uncharacterized protein n=1 Tax=Acorus calamus TaxID=4465 RepID=A0AAV9EN88_ACOCL|nr:hypothetical protein QJS10_CPA06g00163 [Acorus calamus]
MQTPSAFKNRSPKSVKNFFFLNLQLQGMVGNGLLCDPSQNDLPVTSTWRRHVDLMDMSVSGTTTCINATGRPENIMGVKGHLSNHGPGCMGRNSGPNQRTRGSAYA